MDNLISSDILWSAQEAQQKTKEVLKNYNSQELSEISKRIKRDGCQRWSFYNVYRRTE